jgi:formylglycine-generating enzyme required for sulfatase activity
MSPSVHIHEPLGERVASLPLDLGGEGADLPLPGATGPSLRITAAGRQWLAESLHTDASSAAPLINGLPPRTAQPLVDGDVITLGDAQVIVHPAAGRLEVLHLAGNATVAPLRQELLPGDEVEAGVREVFAADAPKVAAPVVRKSRGLRYAVLGIAAALVLVVVGVMLALVPVPVKVLPDGASMSAPDLVHWRSGDRIFLLPGQRQVEISHPGYRSRVLRLNVSRALADATPLEVELEYLPGVITIDTGGVEAELLVDGRVAGKAPGDIEVPAGVHDLILRAPDHVDHVTRLQVEGGGQRQTLVAQLEPSLGFLVLDTNPRGASIRVDGNALGEAPKQLELPAGLHDVVLTAADGRSWRSEVAIIAGQTLDLGRVDLARAPRPAPPPVASAPTGSATETAPLSAASEVLPPPPPAPPAPKLTVPLVGTLVLFPAGEYTQGSGRREQGRRSNEVERRVKLTRPFYLSATEISNAQFRAFRPNHVAGIAAGQSLDLDTQAVSNVTWNDAVEFCNWLSLREGLPVAYERRDGRWQLVQPVNNGYRLPTEAEWEYAARYVDGQRWQRYPWGDTLPPPPGAANIAGEEAETDRARREGTMRGHLPGYRDEHPAIGPVDGYKPTPMGIYGLGGNVSEWVHDVYESLPAAGTVTDPMGPATNGPHAIRGPSWRTSGIGELRPAWRERGGNAAPDVGFRVARYAGEAP